MSSEAQINFAYSAMGSPIGNLEKKYSRENTHMSYIKSYFIHLKFLAPEIKAPSLIHHSMDAIRNIQLQITPNAFTQNVT